MPLPTYDVLLVESDEHDYRVTADLISNNSFGTYRVSRACSLADALHRLQTDGADAVIADLSLSDSEGFDTYRQLSAHAPFLPVILFTGSDNERLAISCVESGAQDCLIKGEADEVSLSRALRLAIARLRFEYASRSREEQELVDFFQNSPVPVHWVGADGSFIRVNTAELNLLGYARSELIGTPFADLHVDRSKFDIWFDRLLAGESVRDHACRIRAKDGSIKDVLIDANVYFDKGRFIHTRCLTRDVTASKRAETCTALQNAVLTAVNHNGSAVEALESIVSNFGTLLDADCGFLWLTDREAKRNRCLADWASTSGGINECQLAMRKADLALGKGLPAIAHNRSDTVWIDDLSDFAGGALREPFHRLAQLRSALLLPLTGDSHETLGVLELVSRRTGGADAPLRDVLSDLGRALGRFIERNRAELKESLASIRERSSSSVHADEVGVRRWS